MCVCLIQVYNLIFGTYPKVGTRGDGRDEGQHGPGEKLVQLEVQHVGRTHISFYYMHN